MSSLCLLAPMVSEQKQHLTEDSLYTMSCLSLPSLRFSLCPWQCVISLRWSYLECVGLLRCIDKWTLGTLCLQIFFLLLSIFMRLSFCYASMIDTVSCASEALFIFLHSGSFCSLDWIISIDLCSSLLSLSFAAQVCCWIPLVDFLFQVLYFLTTEFLFGSFTKWVLSLLWYSLFDKTRFS
jgi:hypothetical protein